jgi:hypothetical protein
VHQDEALVKRLRFGAKWREEEREYSEDCYLRYLAKSNRLRKVEVCESLPKRNRLINDENIGKT